MKRASGTGVIAIIRLGFTGGIRSRYRVSSRPICPLRLSTTVSRHCWPATANSPAHPERTFNHPQPVLVGNQIERVRDLQPVPNAGDAKVSEDDVSAIGAAVGGQLAVYEIPRMVGVQVQLVIIDIPEQGGGRNGRDEPAGNFFSRKHRLFLKRRQSVLGIVVKINPQRRSRCRAPLHDHDACHGSYGTTRTPSEFSTKINVFVLAFVRGRVI